MNERITLVSLFDQKNLNRINAIINKINVPLCKVPFGKNVDDRMKVDTLPYHFTLSAWDIENENYIVQQLEDLQYSKFNVEIDGIDIMNGKENSYVLYFKIKENDELTRLQKQIYAILPTEKYNPNKFEFHITIHIDQDYEKIIRIKNQIEQNFIPLELEVNALGLYEIYPANLIKQANAI